MVTLELIVLFSIPVFLLLLTLTVLVHIFFQIPYVPSRNKIVQKMVKVADLKKHEQVYDLGCGDGRLLIEAEKQANVYGTGFEIAPLVFLLAWLKKNITRSRFSLRFQNLFHVNLKKADVIFCYLLPEAMQKISEKIRRECKKGTRIISHTFRLPGFKPVKIIPKNAKRHTPSIYLYRV